MYVTDYALKNALIGSCLILHVAAAHKSDCLLVFSYMLSWRFGTQRDLVSTLWTRLVPMLVLYSNMPGYETSPCACSLTLYRVTHWQSIRGFPHRNGIPLVGNLTLCF